MEKQAATQPAEEFYIEEVSDLTAAWPELEPLTLGLIDYHRPWDERHLKPEWASIMLEHMKGQGLTLIARDSSGTAVGFVSGGVSDAMIFSDMTGHIDNVFLTEAARRHGVGTKLLQRFEAWCVGHGASELRIEVNAGNEPGKRFWMRSGYSVTSLEMRKSLEAAR
jgi:GNAT superfamily N-acetyltransferase